MDVAAGDEFFAGAAFAAHKDGCVGVGNAGDLFVNLGNRGTVAHKFAFDLELRSQRLIGAGERFLLLKLLVAIASCLATATVNSKSSTDKGRRMSEQ